MWAPGLGKQPRISIKSIKFIVLPKSLTKSTSIWATEVSHELPQSALIDGFDVSAAQYPHRSWLPKNVHLHVHDAFAPFPPDRIGMYDIVHLRFFFTLLDPENVQGMLENLMTLLSESLCLKYITRL